MQVSKEHRQGAQRLVTSLQREVKVSGNFSVAASKLEIDEPFKDRKRKKGKQLTLLFFATELIFQ